MSGHFEAISHGRYGGEIIDDTNAHVGSWPFFQVVNESVIAAVTAAKVVNADGLVGLTLAEGTFHYGPFTSITLTSGVVKMFAEIEG